VAVSSQLSTFRPTLLRYDACDLAPVDVCIVKLDEEAKSLDF